MFGKGKPGIKRPFVLNVLFCISILYMVAFFGATLALQIQYGTPPLRIKGPGNSQYLETGELANSTVAGDLGKAHPRWFAFALIAFQTLFLWMIWMKGLFSDFYGNVGASEQEEYLSTASVDIDDDIDDNEQNRKKKPEAECKTVAHNYPRFLDGFYWLHGGLIPATVFLFIAIQTDGAFDALYDGVLMQFVTQLYLALPITDLYCHSVEAFLGSFWVFFGVQFLYWMKWTLELPINRSLDPTHSSPYLMVWLGWTLFYILVVMGIVWYKVIRKFNENNRVSIVQSETARLYVVYMDCIFIWVSGLLVILFIK